MPRLVFKPFPRHPSFMHLVNKQITPKMYCALCLRLPWNVSIAGERLCVRCKVAYCAQCVPHMVYDGPVCDACIKNGEL